MASLSNLKESPGKCVENSVFHVKGAGSLSWGMKDRLSRIFNPRTGKTVMLAFDHGFIMGPTSGLERIDLSIVPLIPYADCLMCTRNFTSHITHTDIIRMVAFTIDFQNHFLAFN